MRRRDEAALAEFVNENSQLYGATLAAEWRAPESVELLGGVLRIRSALSYWSRGKPGRLIRPPRGLLDSFLALARGSTEKNTMRALVSGSSRSDERICAFARRFGGLQIFCRSGGAAVWPVREHLEYCEVWRYFAHALGALQRIASAFYRGAAEEKEDWELIHRVPEAMGQAAQEDSPGLLRPFPEGDERNWLALAYFAGQPRGRNRALLVHMVNTVVGLGCVRPWFSWPGAAGRPARPEIVYSGQSLLSQLALQLALRLAKVDHFLVCVHCHKPYSLVVRAPKSGQRNFCPDCRRAGVPKQYALRDFRHRQRQSQGG